MELPIQSKALNLNVDELISDPSLLKIYGNTFTASFSIVDATLVILHGSSPVCVVSMSHQSAKLLQMQVDNVVNQIEASFGTQLPNLENDIKKIAESNQPK